MSDILTDEQLDTLARSATEKLKLHPEEWGLRAVATLVRELREAAQLLEGAVYAYEADAEIPIAHPNIHKARTHLDARRRESAPIPDLSQKSPLRIVESVTTQNVSDEPKRYEDEGSERGRRK